MCKIYAVANSKGGIGKTTTVHSVGIALQKIGYKVLLVDSDTQGHLSVLFSIIPESLENTLTNLIDKYINQETITKEIVKKSIIKTDTIDLLPSTFNMDKLEKPLEAINGREYALSEALNFINDEYDYILIDCNSSRNIFTINALSAADSVILPSQTQYLSSGAIELMLSTIKSLKRRINPNLNIKGILLTMYQTNTIQSKSTSFEVREEYGSMVFNTIIPSSTKVADAQKKGLSIIEYDKNNQVSIAYNEFVKEIL